MKLVRLNWHLERPMIAILLLFSTTVFAETGTLTVKPMHCSSCAEQVTKAVCENKEMTTWFESCKAEATHPDKKEGQLVFTTKKDIKMDGEKQHKIEVALEGINRKVLTSSYK